VTICPACGKRPRYAPGQKCRQCISETKKALRGNLPKELWARRDVHRHRYMNELKANATVMVFGGDEVLSGMAFLLSDVLNLNELSPLGSVRP